MKKNLVIMSLVVVLLMVIKVEVSANENPDVFLDDKTLSFDVKPILVNGVTFIELRGLCNALDYKIGWQQSTRTASCIGGNHSFSFSSNDNFYTFNNQQRSFIHKPRLINGRTMLSLREVSEVFTKRVIWLTPSREILLLSPNLSDELKGKLVDDFLNRLHKKQQFTGAALIARNGKVLSSNGYGYADQERKVSNQPQTQFAIASITKGFTGTAIMQLQEQGKLNVNDKLGKYFPDLPYANQITIHQLLTHTAGLPWEKDTDYKNIKLIYQPGQGQRYSNVGYMLLGDIIEKVSGKSYQAYMNDHVFTGTGMSASGFDLNSSQSEVKAKGYQWQNGKWASVNRDFSSRGGSGALYSSVEDLYQLDQALTNSELMSRSTMHTMLTPHEGAWGYGWQVFLSQTGRVSILSGSTTGFTSHIKRHEGRKYVVILLSNHADSKMDLITSSIEYIIQ
ncbi:serine hydrolase [Alkalihalophilus marmarensis]|uniref:serine hydrolase n=1 Tax=Alkalihalophilus marmarensis TaxID=521377 RepID=UPI00203E535E|nr:serine hydrolase [Alkalihalophilus marmarensis]MCM3489990.1 serine hydrolase [Alkalihalophilus marmarensis]